jgi:DNA-3-methyladenine glycosylase
MKTSKLNSEFFDRDVLLVAPDLVGKILVRQFEDGQQIRLRITETEAYRGEEDKGCHASKGKTPRTEVMYMSPGTIYIYLIYGMYQMLNFVTERENVPHAILIRGAGEFNGPGKLTKALKITRDLNRQNICSNNELWIEDDGYEAMIITATRVGIDYAGEEWASKPWRFIDKYSQMGII